MKNQKIAIVFGSFRSGGAEKVMINLANGFSSNGIETEIVVLEDGPLVDLVNDKIRIINLGKRRARKAIGAFRKYLKDANPTVIIVAQTHMHIMSLIAMRNIKNCFLILNEHSTISFNSKNFMQRFLFRIFSKRANAITLISRGAYDDFRRVFPKLKRKTEIIHNAVYSEDINEKQLEQANHPFLLNKNIPVILFAGRLVKSKNVLLLLDAFKLVMREQEVRLIILGDGEERLKLERYANENGISSHISFMGNVQNPYAYMNRCDLFVLTSNYEGLPTVLIEALACGCNIVSTDCKSGPAEILENGRFGTLVPVKVSESLAVAIMQNLVENNNKINNLKRAHDFSVSAAVQKYLDLIGDVT